MLEQRRRKASRQRGDERLLPAGMSVSARPQAPHSDTATTRRSGKATSSRPHCRSTPKSIGSLTENGATLSDNRQVFDHLPPPGRPGTEPLGIPVSRLLWQLERLPAVAAG